MDINYSKQAAKFLEKQPSLVQKRIITAIEKIPAGDIKKLQGRNGFRLRIGDFRVIFDRQGNIIDIIDIGNRGQVYK